MNTHEDGPKRTVSGSLVKILAHTRTDRGMELDSFASRCLQRNEIHELVGTDHLDLSFGDKVDRVGFLGFCEMSVGGVVDKGDTVTVGGRAIGTVAGFDSCHLPNHYNIIIEVATCASGTELGMEPGDDVEFRQKNHMEM